jgi:predicted MPP superfamily phosphohydrolase
MSISRRSFLKTSLTTTGGLFATSVAYAGYGYAHSYFTSADVTSYQVNTRKLPADFALNIAFVTDMHVGCPTMSLEQTAHIVEQVNDLQPDIILLGGDHQINKHYDWRTKFLSPAPIAHVLKALDAPMGVYGVMGNHDWDRSHDGMMRALNKTSHIRIGENERLTLCKDNTEFDLVLLPDYKTRGHHFDCDVFDNLDKRPTFVVSHDPMFFRDVPDDTILQLSGHTHGGQVTLMGVPLYLPTHGLPLNWAYGHINMQDNKQMIVSSGLGTSTASIKTTPNEIVQVRVQGLGL